MTASAVTLPSNFYDTTSPKLLKQPEPQYFWLMLLAAAEAKSTLAAAGMIGMPGREITGGNFAYASELDRLMLAAASECSEAVTVEESLGSGPGHTVRINRPAFSGGGYTEGDRQIGPSASISTTPIDVSGEQSTITLKRVVGPFASGGSVPQPYAIDAMDAKLGVHKLSDIVALHLRRDRMKYADTVCGAYFDEAATAILYVGSQTVDNDYATANAGPCGAELLFRVEESLSTRHIPTFSNGRWKMALHSRAIRQLKSDSIYAAYAKAHADGKNPLFPGYVTTLGRLDLYEVNTIGSTANSSSVTVYRNVAFGPGAVGYGVGKRPTVQPSTDDNYGETAKVIWCAYEGFSCLDERFLVSARTT
jgi:hypothetical protein